MGKRKIIVINEHFLGGIIKIDAVGSQRKVQEKLKAYPHGVTKRAREKNFKRLQAGEIVLMKLPNDRMLSLKMLWL
jgi:hypothetical protein